MKAIIAKLRIAALVSFALFFISTLVVTSDSVNYKFNQVQSVLILVSFVLFLIIMALQVYTFYIGSYRHNEADENSTS